VTATTAPKPHRQMIDAGGCNRRSIPGLPLASSEDDGLAWCRKKHSWERGDRSGPAAARQIISSTIGHGQTPAMRYWSKAAK